MLPAPIVPVLVSHLRPLPPGRSVFSTRARSTPLSTALASPLPMVAVRSVPPMRSWSTVALPPPANATVWSVLFSRNTSPLRLSTLFTLTSAWPRIRCSPASRETV